MRLNCLLAMCVVLTGCANVYPAAISPTPWVTMEPEPLDAVDSGQQDISQMLYVTDRNVLETGQGFGVDRSTSMSFGHIRIVPSNMEQEDFADYMSGRAVSAKRPSYTATLSDAITPFPGTPLPFAIENGVISRDRSAVASYQAVSRQFKDALTQELAARNTGKVVLYVHGFNNTFEDGAFNLFELWSASRWSGVPILFSWPTGGHETFGYFSDTEDGDFSVFHLKETLRLIAATNAVDEVVLITHSHGASIVTSALRELLIESRGAGLSMRDTYRIDSLIMAAPDIDLGVMEQRLVTELFGMGFGQIEVYLNPDDNALGLAGWIFGSPRFGAARPDQLSPQSRAVFQGVRSVHFIMVKDANQFDRHSYFRRHPGVLSDIAITIRTGARPADPERPLKHLELNFWEIDRSYQPVLCSGPSSCGGSPPPTAHRCQDVHNDSPATIGTSEEPHTTPTSPDCLRASGKRN